MKKKRILYLISLTMMITTYLPVLTTNLPPFIRSHHLWVGIWSIALLSFHPKIFLDKLMLYLLFFGLFILGARYSFWSNMDNWNFHLILNEFYNIIVGYSIITVFLQSKDYIGLARLTKWSVIFIIITSIMTIISSFIDPEYARKAQSVFSESEVNFKKLGAGYYSTAGALMALFPILIYYYKHKDLSILNKKELLLLFFLFFIALIKMQIFAYILLTLTIIIISLYGIKRSKQSIIIVSMIIIVFISLPKESYVNSLLSLSNYFTKSIVINSKIKDLAAFIEIGGEVNTGVTETGARIERYPLLWETFKKQPILGCYYNSNKSFNQYISEGAHLHWMNKLATTGLMGTIIFLIIPFSIFKRQFYNLGTEYRYYYLISVLAIIFHGFFKVIAGRETWYIIIVIVPGLYYLQLLKKTRKNIYSENKSTYIAPA